MGCAKSRDANFGLNESSITQQEIILGIYKKEVLKLEFALKKFGLSERINEKQLLLSLQYANLPNWANEEDETNNIKFFYQNFLEKDLYKRDELVLALIFLSGSNSIKKASFVFENLDWKTQGIIDKSKVQKYADIICHVTDYILPQMAILNLKEMQAELNLGQTQPKNYNQKRKQEEITQEIKKLESLIHQWQKHNIAQIVVDQLMGLRNEQIKREIFMINFCQTRPYDFTSPNGFYESHSVVQEKA